MNHILVGDIFPLYYIELFSHMYTSLLYAFTYYALGPSCVKFYIARIYYLKMPV